MTTFRGRTSELTSVKAERCTVLIDGVSYSVRDVKPDGTGTTTIKIMKA